MWDFAGRAETIFDALLGTHNTAMAALLSLVGLLYTFDTLLQFLSGLALTWCGLGLLGGDDQVGVVLPFRSLMGHTPCARVPSAVRAW